MNQNDITNINILSKKDLLMNSLTKFFTKDNNIDYLLPISNGSSKISLRIIDWFVTNYAKKNNTNYILLDKNDIKKQFIVHLSYKSQLKAYNKKQFDPFCRKERIIFRYSNDQEIITTVGQLNFFNWAIQSKVLEYIQNNLKLIEEDMNQSVRKQYGGKKNSLKKTKKCLETNSGKIRRKRQELSVSATKSISKHDVDILVKFE
jgi:hypothetical protein